RQKELDVLFRGVDLLLYISKRSEEEISLWETDHATEINDFLQALAQLMPQDQVSKSAAADVSTVPGVGETDQSRSDTATSAGSSGVATRIAGSESLLSQPAKVEPPDRVLRLTAENLNRLLGLAGESLVVSRWLHPFADSMLRLKRRQSELAK